MKRVVWCQKVKLIGRGLGCEEKGMKGLDVGQIMDRMLSQYANSKLLEIPLKKKNSQQGFGKNMDWNRCRVVR